VYAGARGQTAMRENGHLSHNVAFCRCLAAKYNDFVDCHVKELLGERDE